MSAADRRLPVLFEEAVWAHAIDGLSNKSKEIATSARAQLEAEGVGLTDVLVCDAEGSDGTELADCVKLYLPWRDAPPSERPFAFVLRLRRDKTALVWNFVAFGPRHPRPGVRTVYERAHRQIHGHFPR